MAGRVITVLVLGLFVGSSASGDQRVLESRQVELSNNGALLAERGLATRELAEKNKQEGAAFLTANKERAGVSVLESGLQYKILKAGDRAKPAMDDAVVVHYRGTLIDGTEFDSSHKRNQPATFRVARVIKGWSEALQLMPVGSTWQIFIPSDLAYGARGAGRTIGPNTALIFEVELLSIKGSVGNDSQASAKPAISDIQFSYKLDPRLTRGLYMGDRWISPRVYTGTGGQDSVEARVQGVDVSGRPMAISPTWIPSDPDMVAVTPIEGNEVQITVKHAGQSSLRVTFDGMTKVLVINAEQNGGAIRLAIAQES